MIQLRPAVPQDADLFAPLIRKPDRFEVLRMGRFVDEALRTSVLCSVSSWVALDGNRPLCMFGVEYSGLLTPRVGLPWLLGTDALNCHKREFMRLSRLMLDMWKPDYDALYVSVDAAYGASLRWLVWLGFRFMFAETTVIGCDFRRMGWER